MREMRKLKLDPNKVDLLTQEAGRLDDLVIPDDSDPVNRFKLRFSQTGEYLRPDDMRWCVEKTNFTEDQIADWFRSFKVDCPDGRLTRDHLRSLFRTAFPDGMIRSLINDE